MKKNLILILLAFGLLFPACSKTSETPAEAPATDNPFFAEYDTPFKVPPFDIIKPENFVPAYEKGMEQQKAEIEKLVSNSDPPTFDNTVVALDRSSKLFSDVSRAFGGLSGANTNDDLKAIQKEKLKITKIFPTFHWAEAASWDIAYCATRGIQINLDKLLNFNPNEFVPYGLTIIGGA